MVQQFTYSTLPGWLKGKLILWLVALLPINLIPGQSFDKESNDPELSTTDRKFDREQWNSLKDGVTFLDEKAKNRGNKTEEGNNNASGSQLFSILIKIVFIVLAIVVFALLINQFLGDMIFTPRNKKIDRQKRIEFDDL